MVLGMETKILVWKYGFLWISVDFVWPLLDFSMELTKVCVELVWRLCFGVEFVWILNFGFIPTFGVVLGLIVGWFYAVFLACLVPCLWHVLWPQLGGYCGRWTRDVSRWFQVKIWRILELPRSSLARRCVEATLLRGWAQICNPRVHNCVGFHAIA